MAKTLTPEEFFGQGSANTLTPEEFFVEPGFSQRLGKDIDQRASNILEAGVQNALGERTPLETAVKVGGNLAGAGYDVLGNVIGSGYRALPDSEYGLGEAGQYIMESPIGDAMRYVGENIGEVAQKYPRAADYFGGLANIAGVAPTGQAAKATVQGGSQVAKKVGMAGLEKAAQVKQPPIGAEDFRNMAIAARKEAMDSGEVFSAPAVSDPFLEAFEKAKPAKIAGEVDIDLALDLERTLGKYKKLKGKPLDIEEIARMDRELTGLKYKAFNTGDNDLGIELGNLQGTLRESLNTAPAGQKLTKATDFFRRSYQLDDIEKIFRNAQGRPNEAAIIQSGFRQLANQARKKGSGYTEEQIVLMDKAAKGGLSIDALKLASSRLLTLGSGIAGGAGAGTAAYMANIAAGAGATALQTAKGAKVAQSITGDITNIGSPTLLNKTAQNILNRIKAGDKTAKNELLKLPPKEAQGILNQLLKDEQGY